MNKNILFLINGLGIQNRDSYDIEINKCMPNLNSYVNSNLFSTMHSNTFDYKEGYAFISVGSKLPITFQTIEKETELDKMVNNEVLTTLSNNIKTKLHIFCYLDDPQTYNHLKSYVKSIYNIKKCTIFIHLILTQKVIDGYNDVNKFVTKISYDLINYAKVGIILGEDALNLKEPKELVKVCFSEIAEIWKELDLKLKSLINNKIQPCMVKPFIVNKGFKFENADTLLFFNYNSKNITSFLNYISFNPITRENINLSLYSIYPMASNIIPIHKYVSSSKSLANDLKLIDRNCLVICDKDKINYINYYLNGYNNVVSDKINYAILNDNLINLINTTNYNLYIINYDVGNTNDYILFRSNLTKIDNILKQIYDISITNNYSLFISSLYGINKKLFENKISRYINFSSKLPLILVDKKYDNNYLLKDGNVYTLMQMILKNMNETFPADYLVIRKSKLFSFMKK